MAALRPTLRLVRVNRRFGLDRMVRVLSEYCLRPGFAPRAERLSRLDDSSVEGPPTKSAGPLLADGFYHVTGLEPTSRNRGCNRRDIVNIGHANDANLTGQAADHFSGGRILDFLRHPLD